MGDRGPHAKTNIRVLAPVKKRRPNPKPGMSPKARTIWLKIVRAYPPDHFKPQHTGMLRSYCEAEALHDRAVAAIIKSGDIIKQPNGVVKENPYINIEIKATNVMSQLGTKLGITANATTVARGDGGANTKPKSKREGLLFKG